MRIILPALVVLGAAGAFTFAHFRAATPRPAVVAAPTPVSFVTIAPRDTPEAITFVARTESAQAVQINARVEGFLDSRTYAEGQLVHAGDVLFEMDPKPFQASLDAANAALAGQQAALTVARETLARVEPLAKAGALSQKDLDDARGAADRAAAAVDEARATAEKAALDLSYTTIRSPVTGIADAALQQDGSYIGVGNAALTTVYLVSPMWVNFSVSENQMIAWKQQVGTGALKAPADGTFTFSLVLPDGTAYPNGGTVTFMSPAFDPETGTFLVRGTFDNPDGAIRPNQYLTALVSGFTRPNAILVPQRAIHQSATGHVVWLVDAAGTAELRPVEVGDWRGPDWIVTSGLAEGDRVVVDGLVRRPGTPLAATPLAHPAGAGN